MIMDVGVRSGDPVVDLGAGTGILTRQLVERGFRVAAVEPNAEMRNWADLQGAEWIDGSFEETRLGSGSQKWAVAAQAFHWADPARALPEIHRILERGSHLTVLWNVKRADSNPVLRWISAAIDRHVPGFREAYDGADWMTVLESTGHFRFVGKRAVNHCEPMARSRFVDLWKSHHWLRQSASPNAFKALLTDLEDYLASLEDDEINVPYECVAWSAVRYD
jgi:ubiquinone/menaquinone biosynthesis C-methylase UbiE